MRVCAVVSTYNRAHLLPYILWCFQQQTHKDKCLFIYDDHGQHRTQEGGDVRLRDGLHDSDWWRLESRNDPCKTLGQKRNEAIRLAADWCGADAYAVWDDDDAYLPHALEAVAFACRGADWCRPSLVWHRGQNGLTCHRTYGAEDRVDKAYQSGWAFSRELVGDLWPDATYTEDRALARKMLAEFVCEADPCVKFPPYLVYDPYKSIDRLSCLGGAMGWQLRATEKLKTPDLLTPQQPPVDLTIPAGPNGTFNVYPRPWGPAGDWLERKHTA
jgi:hypothetical protein